MAKTQPKIIVVSGQENDGPFFIDPRIDVLTIGQGADNHICLPDPRVSPAHCRLFQRDGRWFVEDLGSDAGTLVNGTPITGTQEIEDVDKLELGPYLLQFLLEEPPEAVRPARPRRPRSNVLQVPPTQGAPAGQVEPAPAAQPPWPTDPAPPPPPPGPVGVGPPAQGPGMAPPFAPLPPPGPGPQPGMIPPAQPPGIGPPPGAAGPTGPGRATGAGPASKICKCGLLLMADAGGFACPVCKRKYDQSGQESGATASARGPGPAGGSFLTGRTTWVVVGGVLMLAVLVVLGVIVFSPDPPPVPKPGTTPPSKTEKLPKPSSEMLDIVVRSAIALDVMDKAVKPPPQEMTSKAGQELAVKIEGQSHSFLVVTDLKVTLAWTDVVAKVTSDLTGLSLKVLKKIPVGSGRFEPDDVLDRKADGWYITRAKK